jgi:predicted S18 family serine protease
VTIYGESLSAMVGLTVIALAKGDTILSDRVLTGIVSPDGRIAPVGGVSLKVAAANETHLRRVLIPDEVDTADSDWRTPFLMHISPVGSVSEAYQALTDRPLHP